MPGTRLTSLRSFTLSVTFVQWTRLVRRSLKWFKFTWTIRIRSSLLGWLRWSTLITAGKFKIGGLNDKSASQYTHTCCFFFEVTQTYMKLNSQLRLLNAPRTRAHTRTRTIEKASNAWYGTKLGDRGGVSTWTCVSRSGSTQCASTRTTGYRCVFACMCVRARACVCM